VQVSIVVEQCLAPVPGGTGRYAAEVATALAAVPGVAVTGWSAWHRGVRPGWLPGVQGPRRLPLGRRALVAAWERGLGPGLGAGADVVHAPTLLAPPRGRRPLVVTVHDTVPWTHPETLTPRGVRWHRAMAARAAAHADAVVVPTHAVAAALREHVRPRRVEVVGEGVSSALGALPADADARAAALGLPGGPFLASLATMEPRKGLDVLVRALADPAAPDLPLVVVGQAGWGGVDVHELAREAGLAPDRLRVLGRIPDEDLALVLARASLLVVPSRAEGFGLPVLEGMAAGVPVVTSDDPALVEVGGDATVAVPVGDAAALARALGELAADDAQRAGMVAAGRARAAGYTWAGAAASLLSLYEDLG
jgi:glycosyltransferase involved in cell wall biosynthesis